jgi:branched-chain amino acid transport system substrate-binding protein
MDDRQARAASLSVLKEQLMTNACIRLATAWAITAAAASAHADITIGVNLSLTGPLSSLGLPQKASLALWPQQIAGEKIRMVVFDDASDPTGATSNARRLVTEDKVDVLLGPSGVPEGIAVAQVATEAKTVQLAFAPMPLPAGPGSWTFALAQPVSLMSDALAHRMVGDKVRKVAFLGWSEGYGEMWLQAFGASAKAAGLEVVATERFAPNDTAITAQALKVLAAKPDAVLIVGAGSAAAMPQINLRERGWTGPIYQTHGAASPDLVRVGGKAMNGTVLPAGPMLVAEQLPGTSPVKPVALAYVSAYEKGNGANSRTQFGAHAWDALMLLQRTVPVALKKARPGTPEFRRALRDALESEKEIALAHGVANFTLADHNGFDNRGVVMLRIAEGRFQLLGD